MDTHTKLAGICFGHQLIAHFFGGRCAPSEAGWAVGVHSSDILQQHNWMQPAGESISLLSSHKDQVVKLPPDAELYASNDFCPLAGFVVGEHVLTIQGHPEFRKEYARSLMKYRESLLGEAVYNEGIASLAADTQEYLMAQWLINFFKTTS